jgi:hypothetical protein
MDKYDVFAKDALAQMGAEALEELLRDAPPTEDEEELRIRNSCWLRWRGGARKMDRTPKLLFAAIGPWHLVART